MVLFRHIVAFILAQLAIAAPAEHVTRKAGRCETFTLYCGHTLKGLGMYAPFPYTTTYYQTNANSFAQAGALHKSRTRSRWTNGTTDRFLPVKKWMNPCSNVLDRERA